MSGSSDYTLTPNLNLYKPTYDSDEEQWGNHLNANADTLDAAFSPTGGVFLPSSGGTISGPLTVTGRVTIQGGLTLTGLPTTQPAAGSGIVWNNAGVLCVA